MTAGATTWPTVTVVIATRDRPQLLRRALRAVQACRYPGTVETVLVFDQSEPDLGLATDAVRVVANTRSPGLAGARNTGILAASGELVAFCDDDDTWLPGKLELQVPALLGEPTAVVSTTGIFVHVTDGEGAGHSTPRVTPSDRITHADLLRSRVMEAHPSTFLIRRDALLGELGLVDEALPGSYAEDYDLLLRATALAPLVAVGVPLTVVNWHPSSFFFERWQTMASALEHLLAKHPDFAGDPAGLARIEGQLALALAGTGDHHGARARATAALRHDPRQPRAYLGLVASTGLIGPDTVLKAAQRFGKGF